MMSKIKNRSLGTTIGILMFIIIIFSTGAIALTSYLIYRGGAVNQFAERTMMMATSVALAIDGDALTQTVDYAISLEAGRGNDDPWDRDEHWYEVKTYIDEVMTFTDAMYVYIAFTDHRDGVVKIFADAEIPEDTIKPYDLGEKARDDIYPEEMFEVLLTGNQNKTAIFDGGEMESGEEYGYAVAGYAPIKNASGKVVGVVGIEICVDDVLYNVNLFGIIITIAVIGFGLLFYLLSLLIARKGLLQPISQLSTLSEKLAEGQMNIQMKDYGNNELGILSANLINMAVIINGLIEAINDMSVKHEKGDIHATINTTHFKGSYKTVAEGINAMAAASLEDRSMMIDAMREINNGNFNLNIKALPGKKATLNQTIDMLTTNLNNIHKEIENIALGAAKGNFNIKANADLYKGDWAVLLNELNTLVNAVSEPLTEIEFSLTDMAEGNFRTITGRYEGAFDKVKQAVNVTAEATLGYINEIAQILNAISVGDLTGSIDHEYKGSYAPIKQALNTILESLNKTMKDINVAASEVLSESEVIANSSMQLAEGSTKQAHAVEILLETVESVHEKTTLNTENTAVANKLAAESTEHAQGGNEAMKLMVSSMDSINDSSKNITSIIKSIEDVAFQTNLLALNAAVESARAGEHGKGFAVVAEEVRNLASRSQESTKDTAKLIEDSSNKVGEGINAANQAAASLETIISDIHEVSKIISQIAHLSSEQAASISQINAGMNEISLVVHTNSATSEECASASQELNSQAETLRELVSFFKLKS